jgi:hypothetical protein
VIRVPTVPIIIPVIVLGILVGSMMKSAKKNMSKKKLLLAGLLAGGLNAGYSYAVEMITPRPTLPTGFTLNRTFTVSVGLGFYAASFLVGLILILAVFGIAAVYLRIRGRGEAEEVTEEPELEKELEKEPES